MGMRMNDWEWERMGLKNIFLLISTVNREMAKYEPCGVLAKNCPILHYNYDNYDSVETKKQRQFMSPSECRHLVVSCFTSLS